MIFFTFEAVLFVIVSDFVLRDDLAILVVPRSNQCNLKGFHHPNFCSKLHNDKLSLMLK